MTKFKEANDYMCSQPSYKKYIGGCKKIMKPTDDDSDDDKKT